MYDAKAILEVPFGNHTPSTALDLMTTTCTVRRFSQSAQNNENNAPSRWAMVQAIRNFFAVIAPSWAPRSAKFEEVHKLGAYPVDYSEPTQEEVDAANASCAELFETGNWVPVNRKS